jgi:uncharacterized protein (TIGR02217 family)
MAYDNVPYPLSVDRCIGNFEFDTTVVPLGNGAEVRVANWDDALVSFNALHGIRDLNDLRALNKFHILRRGRARSFPVQDPLDCQATFDGSLMRLDVDGNGTAGPFQLTKTYSDAANNWIREITKPESGTIKIYVSGVLKTEATDYTINYLTGKVTFLATHFPAVSAVLEWSGRFYVPVRFVVDKLPIQDVFINLKADADGKLILPKDATASLPEILMIEDRSA